MNRQRLKKIIVSAIMLIVLVLSNIVILGDSVMKVNAAASNFGITVKCSKTKVNVGDNITVSVNLSLTGDAELNFLEYSLGFSSDSLKLVSTTLGNTYKQASLTKNSNMIVWSYSNDTTLITKSAVLFTATFEVLKTKPEPQFSSANLIAEGDFDNCTMSPAAGLGLYLSCAHQNTSGYITEWQATCKGYGLEIMRCNDCSEIIAQRDISPLGHTPGEETETVMPSCEENGEAEVLCARCGALIYSKMLPATGHDFGAWTVVMEATAELEGEEERVCATCNKKETRVIARLEPETEALTTEAATTEEPTTEAATTGEPATEVPTTEAQTTEEPSTEAPTTEKTVTEEERLATPTDVKDNTNSPKTGDGAMPMLAAVIGMFSVVCLVLLKIKRVRL